MSTNEICETPDSGFPYTTCTASGWTGSFQIGNGATIGVFGSSFNIPQPDPDGSNALILQRVSSATQSVNVTASGLYDLAFYVANRSAPAGDNGPQTVTVSLDGTTEATLTGLAAAWTLETLPLDLTSGTHMLTLASLGTTPSTDVTAFIDDVTLNPATAAAPEPATLGAFGVGLSLLSLFTLRRRKA